MPLSSQDSKLIENRWKSIRDQVSGRWPQLSADDLKQIGGDSRKLVALVHQRTGQSLPEIENGIDEIAASSGGLMSRIASSVSQTVSAATAAVSERATATYDRSAEMIGDRYESVCESVQRSPTRNVCIVFGVGLMAGLLLASSSRFRY